MNRRDFLLTSAVGFFAFPAIANRFFGCGSASAASIMPAGMTSLSLTFDDGYYSPDMATAIAKMDSYSIPGTFYIVPGNVGDGDSHFSWDDLRTLYAKGHEIGNHTQLHGDPSKESTDAFKSDVDQGEKSLRQQGFLQVSSFAIPFGNGYNLSPGGQVVLDPDLLAALNSLGYITTSRQAFEGDNPSFFNDVSSFDPMAVRVYSWKGGTPVSYITGLINQAKINRQWLVLVVHVVTKYPDPNDKDQISLKDFETVIAYIHKNKIVTNPVTKAAGEIVYQQQLS
jgi:peptidoglycan/xylan/chitin deacetylase (PgdA/CDA1 family)